MKRTTLLISLLLIVFFTKAQENPKKCGTTPLMEYEMQTNPQYKDIVENYFNGLKEWLRNNSDPKNSVITIPVVVHVIHRQNHATIGSGTNIHDNQINDAIAILNEDFRKLNPEFPNPPRNTFSSNAGDAEIEFCLATKDENGNSTTGITRTATTITSFDCDGVLTGRNDMKRTATGGKDGWYALKYLNIWVCNLSNSQGGGQTLGFSYLPGVQSASWNAWKDGIVVDFQHFGSILQAGNSDGRTPTHEVGHYLGLFHTFCEDEDAQGNPICCDNDNNIFAGFVDDTPAAKDIYFGLVNNTTPSTSSPDYNSCNDLNYGFSSNYPDMHENFMSYAANTWMFSNKQIDVMNYTLNQSWNNGGRLELKNSDGCMTVGIIDALTNKLIDIYPNPTDGKLNFKFAMNIKVNSIVIQNILGEEIVRTEDIQDNIFSIDLSSLPIGIYFAYLDTDKGGSIEKILLSE